MYVFIELLGSQPSGYAYPSRALHCKDTKGKTHCRAYFTSVSPRLLTSSGRVHGIELSIYSISLYSRPRTLSRLENSIVRFIYSSQGSETGNSTGKDTFVTDGGISEAQSSRGEKNTIMIDNMCHRILTSRSLCDYFRNAVISRMQFLVGILEHSIRP